MSTSKQIWLLTRVFALVCCAAIAPAPAAQQGSDDAQPKPQSPGVAITIDPGYDLYSTPPGFSYIDFAANPIPDHFFGLGSLPFAEIVPLRGEPFDTVPSGRIFPSDTVIHRVDQVTLPDPNSSGTTRIEATALRLFSVAPITIEFSDPPSSVQYIVEVKVSPTPAPYGSMTIRRGPCEGGTFTSTLKVHPRFIFRRTDGTGFMVYDTGAQGLPALELTTLNGHWLDYDPNLSLRVPNTTVEILAASPTGQVFVYPPTTPFFPGVRIARCGTGCAGPVLSRSRLMQELGPFAAQGVIPAHTSAESDTDADGVGSNTDNCPTVFNGLQMDADDDSVGDACDNCPMACNVDQADADMDGRGNVCELPELPGMALAGGKRTTISWGQVGPPETYDILKSDKGNLSVGTECLKQEYPLNAVDDTALPGPGQIRYYLSRLVKDGGTGPWGTASAGTEITSSVCTGGGAACRNALNYQTATVPAPGPGATVAFCAPTADCITGGTPLSRSRASDKLCQNVYGAQCAGNDDCAGANGCCADKVAGADLTLGTCNVSAPDTCAGTDVRCVCGYSVPPDPAPPAVGFRCDCICQTGACPPP